MKLSLCFLAFCGLLIQTAFSGASQKQTIPAAVIPPAAVTAFSSSRMQRLHHNLFHNIRMNFFLLDEIEQREITNLGWKPQYISFTYIDGDINRPVTLLGPTGEDFLFMHRRMIAEVDKISTDAGQTWRVLIHPVANSWENCPAPSSTVWPVPQVPDEIQGAYRDYLSYYKTEEFYTKEIVPREAQMNDVNYLKTLTLGEFGTLIEYELHTFFHVRFAAYNPVGYRIQHLHPTMRIEEKWDNPEYDYLADFYSAHVNPTFWMIHGWIEHKINLWGAQQTPTVTSATITWTSTWERGPMGDEILAALEKVAEDAHYRRFSRDSNPKQVVAAVLGGLLCCVLILLAGYFCMNKMTNKHAGYAKANQQTVTSPV
jgi:hypothetical protein